MHRNKSNITHLLEALTHCGLVIPYGNIDQAITCVGMVLFGSCWWWIWQDLWMWSDLKIPSSWFHLALSNVSEWVDVYMGSHIHRWIWYHKICRAYLIEGSAPRSIRILIDLLLYPTQVYWLPATVWGSCWHPQVGVANSVQSLSRPSESFQANHTLKL